MLLATPSATEVESLKDALDQYSRGLGRIHFPGRVQARAVLLEARLGITQVEGFLGSSGDRFDRYFTRYRIFLVAGDHAIGTVGMDRASGAVDQVAIGGSERLIQGLIAAEKEATQQREARLLRVPQIYLEALVLIGPSDAVTYRTLYPPYRDGVEAKGLEQFRPFVQRLIRDHPKLLGGSR